MKFFSRIQEVNLLQVLNQRISSVQYFFKKMAVVLA